MIKQIPFHFGLFYHAMVGLLGRHPDSKVSQSIDGFYDWVYSPNNDEEEKLFEKNLPILKSWLDNFEILFSESRVDFGHPNDASFGKDGREKVLRIIIQHPPYK